MGMEKLWYDLNFLMVPLVTSHGTLRGQCDIVWETVLSNTGTLLPHYVV
jgi:hypothetical protein